MDTITAGNHVMLTKYSAPHAVVVPIHWYERATAALAATESGE